MISSLSVVRFCKELSYGFSRLVTPRDYYTVATIEVERILLTLNISGK